MRERPLESATMRFVEWLPTRGGDVLAYLLGDWQLERLLQDKATGQRGAFSGTARFTPDHAGAVYHEQGRLGWPTYHGPASRTLRYELFPTGALLVRFADGRPFHSLDVRSRRATFDHRCGEDHYLGVLTLIQHNEWRQDWDVRGPGKRLQIRSGFSR